MTTDTAGQLLHDKATRGQPLSADERTALEAWYARLDAEEAVLLSRTGTAEGAVLQGQIDVALGQLAAVAAQIQTLSAENDALRREIVTLQRRLAQHRTAQPA